MAPVVLPIIPNRMEKITVNSTIPKMIFMTEISDIIMHKQMEGV